MWIKRVFPRIKFILCRNELSFDAYILKLGVNIVPRHRRVSSCCLLVWGRVTRVLAWHDRCDKAWLGRILSDTNGPIATSSGSTIIPLSDTNGPRPHDRALRSYLYQTRTVPRPHDRALRSYLYQTGTVHGHTIGLAPPCLDRPTYPAQPSTLPGHPSLMYIYFQIWPNWVKAWCVRGSQV